MDRDQILRLLGEREAAGRAEWLRLEQEAAQIAELIEQCRREIERLAIAREVLSGLVTEPVGCREVVAVLGEDPAVARHGERVRHRLKKRNGGAAG